MTNYYSVEVFEIVVDTNPEMADMSNPSGAIFADIFYASVETPEGKIYDYNRSYLDEDEAIHDVIFLAGIKANPKDSTSFSFNRVAYGSEYHAKNREEVEVSLMDDEERYHYYK